MTTASTFIRHVIGGGWATDFGGSADVSIQGNVASIPFLATADNIQWKLNGGFDKCGGTSKLNSTVFESGAEVYGMYDYWNIGGSGTPAQHRICHVGTKIKKDDGDESFRWE